MCVCSVYIHLCVSTYSCVVIEKYLFLLSNTEQSNQANDDSSKCYCSEYKDVPPHIEGIKLVAAK